MILMLMDGNDATVKDYAIFIRDREEKYQPQGRSSRGLIYESTNIMN